jgi:putative nucleotidyltransferase with HDIG domain
MEMEHINLIYSKLENDLLSYMEISDLNILNINITRSLYESLRLRDQLTADHSIKVAVYCYLMAKRLDLDNVYEYFIGGLVHDIGKISLPDSILKSDKLINSNKRYKLQDHIHKAAIILEKFPLPTVVHNIVLYHHERFCGSGYLAGLIGNEIPTEARIAAIADVYCAITDPGRKYHTPKSHWEAVKIMASNEKLFDPNLLGEFFELVKDFRPDHVRKNVI